MRIDTVETKVYRFSELSDEAKEKAVERFADVDVTDEWWDSTFEDAAQIGLKITEFDGGQCGYCRGEWTEDAESVAGIIKENHGETCETFKNAENFLTELAEKQKAFEAADDYDPEYEEFEESDEYDEICAEFKRVIREDYLTILRREYEYRTSEAAIVETIEANEYEFTEAGEIYS